MTYGAAGAPLLAVVGGPTGAGKSTLLNSLVRAPVSAAGVLRPTTRQPVLVCNPRDWASVRRHGLRPICAPLMPEGIAVIDAPDIDSIEPSNRALADELFAEADLWLFVTTASRYADAANWRHLRAARARRVALAVVLDRVAAGNAPDIIDHMRDLLGPPEPPLFVIPEAHLDRQGMLPDSITAPLRGWLADVVEAARMGPPQPAIGVAAVRSESAAPPAAAAGLTVELELTSAVPPEPPLAAADADGVPDAEFSPAAPLGSADVAAEDLADGPAPEAVEPPADGPAPAEWPAAARPAAAEFATPEAAASADPEPAEPEAAMQLADPTAADPPEPEPPFADADADGDGVPDAEFSPAAPLGSADLTAEDVADGPTPEAAGPPAADHLPVADADVNTPEEPRKREPEAAASADPEAGEASESAAPGDVDEPSTATTAEAGPRLADVELDNTDEPGLAPVNLEESSQPDTAAGAADEPSKAAQTAAQAATDAATDADGVPGVVESSAESADPSEERPDRAPADIPKAADVGETVKL